MTKLKTETQLPQTIVMPSAFVLKKCTCCNLEFPKTETYFRKNGLGNFWAGSVGMMWDSIKLM